MSKVGSVYNRVDGDDRCAVEATTGLGTISSATMDIEFNDFKVAMNQVIWRDGSAPFTGNLDINSNDILNIADVYGTPVFKGTATFEQGVNFQQDISVLNGISVFNGATVNGGLIVYGDDTVLDTNLNVFGLINGTSMPQNSTYTPVFEPTGGTFTYTQQKGSYTIIEDLTICTITISANLTGTHTGFLRVSLPFTCNSSDPGVGNLGYYEGLENSTGFHGVVYASNASVDINRDAAGLSYSEPMPMADCSSSINLTLTVIYTKV